jgi:hypothetical protein
MLVGFVGIPPLARLLGGAMPDGTGWLLAAAAIPAVWAADTAMKLLRHRPDPHPTNGSGLRA